MVALCLLPLILTQVTTPPPAVPSQDAPQAAVAPKEPDLKSLSIDQLIELLPRVGAEGSFDEKAQEWRADPIVDEMKSRIDKNVPLTPTQLERALTRTGIVFFRAKWPVDEPFEVSMRDSAWLHLIEIHLKPKNTSLKPLEGGITFWEMCGNGVELRTREQMHQILGSLSLGKHHLVFDADLERGEDSFARLKNTPAPPKGIIWSGQLAFDVEIVPTLADAIPPVGKPALTAAVRESFGLCVQNWGQDGKPQAILVFDADTKAHPDLVTTAISAHVELLRDKVVKSEFQLILHRYDILLSNNSVFDGPIKLFSFATLDGFPADKVDDKDEISHWKVRVKGTDQDVLKLWHVETMWTGSFEAPLSEIIQQERDRTKDKPARSFIWMP